MTPWITWIKICAMSSFRPSAAWRQVVRHPALGRGQRHWLDDQGSLTARLRARCVQFDVRVLRQQLLRPGIDECATLPVAPRQLAWGREVLLLADGVPRIFAHSLLARAQARGAWRLFARMGSRPLGAALFADPSIVRESLCFRRLDARHPLYRAAVQAAGLDARHTPGLWARRSRFRRGGHALLVCEVFLPAVYALPAPLALSAM
jgi:chorismate--pyruvate lyase